MWTSVQLVCSSSSSPSTIASICVAFRSFCCESLPLTLSLVVPHFSLPLLRSLHPSRPLMPSSRVGGRGVRADRATVEGRAGAGPTAMESEILDCSEWLESCGALGGGRFCSDCGRNRPGSTSRGWTTDSFTRLWYIEREERGRWVKQALGDKKDADLRRRNKMINKGQQGLS